MMSEFDEGGSYFEFTIDLAGPIAMLFARVPADRRAAVRREIDQEAEKSAGARVRLPGVTWIARARA